MDKAILINSDTLGNGSDDKPEQIIFCNSGVKLLANSGSVITV